MREEASFSACKVQPILRLPCLTSMKRLHGMILRMLPGPILGWLGTLMFLLLMQFLIKYLPDIAGRGLPFFVIGELIAYNLAYMVVLAVPMSILIGTMMVFGRIAETRAYIVIKSAGISPLQLIWPTMVAGLLLTVAMTYFNNIVLPEANFRARNLWHDIRQKRPGFELREGVFYDGISRYSILVQEMSDNTNRLHDVLIYDYTDEDRAQAVIKAREGLIQSREGTSELSLTLEDGEVHRLRRSRKQGIDERYERLQFARYQMSLDLSEFDFERTDPSDGYRSDRTMRTRDMVSLVDSLAQSVKDSKRRIARTGLSLIQPREGLGRTAESGPGGTDLADRLPVALHTVDSLKHRAIFDTAVHHARSSHAVIEDARRGIEWENQRADRFRVEIHKKFSIALACLIFMLIGAPLGLSIRRGGLATIGGLATGIFLFYWVTLVQGEKLADRGFLSPWIGMWTANLVMLGLGLWLMVYVTKDLRATSPLRRRLATLVHKRGRRSIPERAAEPAATA